MLSARITQRLLRALDHLTPKSARIKVSAHLLIGRCGEEDAYFFLRTKGYVIVARNFRTSRHHGEIDVIGWDKDVLCFIEVKTRTTRDIKPAEAAVDRKKRRDLRVMIRYYLRTLPRRQFPTTPQWRFDIVTVYYENTLPLKPTSGLNGPPFSLNNGNANPPFAKVGRKGGAASSLREVPTFELFQNAALSS
ncbi:MAG TPA: YraN family protein [Candidatus Sulfotelmatobacter sp.]|nr:YraN family protein [Candidatus Sulfotelmatobacter sp.]